METNPQETSGTAAETAAPPSADGAAEAPSVTTGIDIGALKTELTSRMVAMSFCEPRSCRLQLSS